MIEWKSPRRVRSAMTAAATTDDLDVEALTRAIAICRAESEDRRKQVDEQLAERDLRTQQMLARHPLRLRAPAEPNR